MKTALQFVQVQSDRLSRCPGMIGFEAPTGPLGRGSVTIEPVCAKSAREWLKRRYVVNDTCCIRETGELRIEIVARARRGTASGRRQLRIAFEAVEQFELGLAVETLETC